MALWGGSTYSSTIDVKAFNKLVNLKTIDTVRRRQGLLYAVLGKMTAPGFGNTTTPGMPSFERMDTAEGNQYEVSMLGQYDVPTAKTDGAQEIAAATYVYNANNWGSSTFYLTHMTKHYAIPASWRDKIAGKSQKGASIEDEVAQYVIGSWDSALGTGINSTNAQVAATIGGWQYAIDDCGNASAPGGGVGTAGYSAYGGTTRATAENYQMCPYMKATVGELTIPDIDVAQSYCELAGGNPTVSVCGVTLHSKIKQLASAYVHTTYDEEWAKFLGNYTQIGPTKFIMDTNGSNTVLPFIDPTTWVFVMKNKGITASYIFDAPWLEASDAVKTEAWIGFICKAVWKNSKLTGIVV